MAEGIEAPLLGLGGIGGRPRGVSFEIAMHAFVTSVLGWARWLDEFWPHAEL
jgi:hypothetical protein